MMKNISTEDLNWLLALASHAISDGRGQADETADIMRRDRLQDLADRTAPMTPPGGWETDVDGEPVAYLLSRDDGGEPTPLYVMRRREVAEKAQRLLQRGSGMRFEILPVPVED